MPTRIRTDAANPFAYHTMGVRLPAILRETAALNPDYSPAVREALAALASQVETDAPISMCDTHTPAAADWADAYAAHAGESWRQSEWFFAETFLYRHVTDAVQWWTSRRDPFAPRKREEEASPALWLALERALSIDPEPVDVRLLDLLEADLWGNKADLSLPVGRQYASTAADWLVDDRERIVAHLFSREVGAVHLVTDNYGTELALDLALVDGLLDGVAESVTLHVKAHPTYVSDATREDVLDFLRLLADERRPLFRALGDRLNAALLDGRLSILPDYGWNSSRFLPDMPALLEALRTADLVIVKGDANYRRVTGDILYDPTTPFAEVLAYTRVPTACIRTMKSDIIVGLRHGQAEALDAADPDWRVNSRRGLIQFKA
jgi:uncharacterized protein with ATP-grasp and redox domains